MALTKERIHEIELLALDVLRDAYATEVLIPPVDLFKIAISNDLEIFEGEFKDTRVEGAFNREKKAIYLESRSPYTRKSFTLAHELGHYFLHADKMQETFYRLNLMDTSADTQEQEANRFAAAILMPKEIFIKFWHLFMDEEEVARRFSVSNQAAYFRAKNLGLI